MQQIENELQRKQKAVEQINQQLSKDQALLEAEARVATQKERLADAKRKQKSAEWELEDLQEKINNTNKKLYGTTIKNPKELLNIEHELESLKRELRKKEDILLDMMAEMETMQGELRASSEKLAGLEQEWQQKQETLNQEKAEIEPQIVRLDRRKQELRSLINPGGLQLYEETKLAKGQAIAKIERGRCQGCHVTLPMTEWRRARSGELVQCGNCGRILYLE